MGVRRRVLRVGNPKQREVGFRATLTDEKIPPPPPQHLRHAGIAAGKHTPQTEGLCRALAFYFLHFYFPAFRSFSPFWPFRPTWPSATSLSISIPSLLSRRAPFPPALFGGERSARIGTDPTATAE